MSKIEYTEPVEDVFTAEHNGKWIEMVTHEFGIVGVSTDSTEKADAGSWGLESGFGHIEFDYEKLFALIELAYFSEIGSARDIAYEAEGDPAVPMWERILHSYGFGKD